MLIAHLMMGLLAGFATVALGWATGSVGWISLAFYVIGGTLGIMTSALMFISRADPYDPWDGLA